MENRRSRNYELVDTDNLNRTRENVFKTKDVDFSQERKTVGHIIAEEQRDVGNMKMSDELNISLGESESKPFIADELEKKEVLENKNKKLSAYDISIDLLSLYEFVVIHDQLFYFVEVGEYWRLLPDSEANRSLRILLPDYCCRYVNKSILYEIFQWLLNLAKKVEDPVKKRRNVLNFLDTAYDWKRCKVINKRKKLYFRYCLQLQFNQLQEHKNYYRSFVDSVFGTDEETKREFRKFLGLCISDIRDKKLSFFLFGPSNTGKSVLLSVLRMIIGAEWSSSVSFTQMSNEFALTQMLGKRINLSGEVSGTTNKRLDIFKSLTGNDYITACYKGKDHFQFRNEAVLVFACNAFPPVQNVLDGSSFLARIRFLPFMNVIPEQDWIDDLAQKIFMDSNDLISDAIQGLRELEEDGFSVLESPSMKECKQQFIASYNSFQLFAEEYLVADVLGKISSGEIRDKYKEYCRELEFAVLPDVQWSQLLLQMYPCQQTTLTVKDEFRGKKRARGYRGVRLVKEDDLMTIPVRNL